MGKALVPIGIALIVAGAVLLCYLGFTVFQAINSPQDVPLVKFIMSDLRVEDKAIYGHAGSDSFEFNMSEPARTVILLFLAALVLMVLASIAKTLISAGINLVSAAGRFQGGDAESQARGSSPAVRRN
jgi:hypothetical protein